MEWTQLCSTSGLEVAVWIATYLMCKFDTSLELATVGIENIVVFQWLHSSEYQKNRYSLIPQLMIVTLRVGLFQLSPFSYLSNEGSFYISSLWLLNSFMWNTCIKLPLILWVILWWNRCRVTCFKLLHKTLLHIHCGRVRHNLIFPMFHS